MTDLPNLVGGALCLDFVNTVDARHAPGRREYLDTYPALLAWSRRAGIIDAARDERLREAAASDPAEADRVLGRAVRLREALYPILSQATRRQPPDLDSLHGELAGAMAHFRVTWSPHGFTWGWEDTRPGLQPGPVARGLVGRRPASPRAARADPGMPGRRELRLAVPRPQQERQQALVRDALVRQPGQSASPLCADAGRQPGLAVRCCAADGRTADGGGHVVCVPAAASAGSGLVSWTGAGSRGCRPRWAAACHTRARLRRRRSRRRRPG